MDNHKEKIKKLHYQLSSQSVAEVEYKKVEDYLNLNSGISETKIRDDIQNLESILWVHKKDPKEFLLAPSEFRTILESTYEEKD